jgi:hypothetical protein
MDIYRSRWGHLALAVTLSALLPGQLSAQTVAPSIGGGVGTNVPRTAFGISAARAAALGNNPYATITSTGTFPTTPGFIPGGNNMYDNPYGMPWYGYGESPIGGYMRGYADVINATTKGLIDEQQASLMKEYVRRERLENKRKELDTWLYFRDRLPTAEDDRQRDLAVRLRRSMNDPPAGEIYSGRAMNVILDDLGKRLGANNAAQGSTPLSADEVVAHLNFTGTENRGNPGLLRYVSTDGGRLPWPLVFSGPMYKSQREVVDTLGRTVYKEAEGGRVDAGNLESMTNAVRQLQQSLTDNIGDLTPNQYGEARRFLSELDDALALLRQPNARDFFGSKAPKGKTIGDLVQEMLSRGLRFAPATAGDEAAYMAVHRALVNYAANTASTIVTDKPPARDQ